jgi:hypothetical protein
MSAGICRRLATLGFSRHARTRKMRGKLVTNPLLKIKRHERKMEAFKNAKTGRRETTEKCFPE